MVTLTLRAAQNKLKLINRLQLRQPFYSRDKNTQCWSWVQNNIFGQNARSLNTLNRRLTAYPLMFFGIGIARKARYDGFSRIIA